MLDLIARRLGWDAVATCVLDELGVAAGGARLIFIQRAEVYATRKFDNLVGDARGICGDATALASWAVPGLAAAANMRRADSPIPILRMVGGSYVRC